MLKDLEISKAFRALVLIVVSILLYTWFVAVQIVATVSLQSPTTIVVAAVCAVGFAVIIFFILLFIYRVWTKKTPNPFRAQDKTKDSAINQPAEDTKDKSTAHSARKSRNVVSPEPN